MASTSENSVGTRERSRVGLTRDKILRTALALIDRDGLEALSMRKLGAELGVEAMSLYNHVPNKDALLDGVTEIMLREIDMTAIDEGPWDEALRAACRSFRSVLLAHPNAMPLIATRPEVTPEGFYPIELSLGVFKKAGFGSEDMVLAHWLVVGYVLGHVGFQVASPLADPDQVDREIALRREKLPPESFPNMHAALPYLEQCDFEAGFEFGLDTIIEGLKLRLA
ncbi:MAG: TetR/AcrR family transcriptional regulator C-terminal domain-containing protein [Actinomycetota bacterium]|nr:TetR/AcrR family transcriptional regulator C-terminal domain-containing protein [Actinomycetota bacterium]